MSKLFSKYLELKNNDSSSIYLFKSGIFFLALQEDAHKISEELNLKITNLNPDIVKCGFPVSRQEHYFRILEAKGIDFTIVDDTYGIVKNYSDYINNDKLKNIVNDIINIDFDNISFKYAYKLLLDTSNSLKKIYKDN